MRFLRIAAPTLAVVAVAIAPVSAQWDVRTARIPRTAEGKADMRAPAPKTPDGKPDLSGVWHADNGFSDNLAGRGADVPMYQWAADLFKHRQETLGRDKPQLRCMPHGVPDAMLIAGLPFKIVQTPGLTIVLYEEFNQYRQVFTDGRAVPVDPNPAWFGYSIGRWDGETFVVESSGFKEGTWLDNGGHPHTEALRLTERFRRRNLGTMELNVDIDDPKAYPKPWKSVTIRFELMPDMELIEHLCENEKDAQHLLGNN